MSLDDVTDLSGVAAEARFSATDLAELEGMLGEVAPAPGMVDVVFAGCLRYDDVIAPPTAVDGFTPRTNGATMQPRLRMTSAEHTPRRASQVQVRRKDASGSGNVRACDDTRTRDRLPAKELGDASRVRVQPSLAFIDVRHRSGFSPSTASSSAFVAIVAPA